MIELLILGTLIGIRRDTVVMSDSQEVDLEASLLTLGFIVSVLIWPLLVAWPLLRMGVPKWLSLLVAIAVGVLAFLVLSFNYLWVGLFAALLGLVVLIFKYA